MMTRVQGVPYQEKNTPGWIKSIASRIVRIWLTFRYQILDRRYGKLVIEEIDGLPLVVLPQVFNPVLFRSGNFLAEFINELPIESGASVLDLGTGSGVGAIFAAKKGALVTAVDINPQAVRNARINVLLNQVEDRVEVLQGDLFQAVEDRQFELIFFNPPFYRGRAQDDLDKAWRSSDIFERFSLEFSGALRPGGRAFVLLSSDGDGWQLLNLIQEQPLSLSIASEKDLINEVLTVYKIEAE